MESESEIWDAWDNHKEKYIMNKKNNTFRLYTFVMYNLSGIQKGIQSLHACVEYSLKYGKAKAYKQWAATDKTVIVLDGGGSSDMENKKGELEVFKFKWASFREPDLNDSTSAIAFLVPESIYGFDEETYKNRVAMGIETWLEDERYQQYKWLKSFRLAAN